MKKLFTKVAEKADAIKKSGVALGVMQFASDINMRMAMAGPGLETEEGGGSLVKNIIGGIVNILPWIGAFFIVAGAFKLVMAYRSDNPDAQTPAAKDIVIGIVLVLFDVLFWDKIIAPAIF